SFERIVNIPARGIGPKSLATFYLWRSKKRLTLLKALKEAGDCQDLTLKARQSFVGLGDLVSSFYELMSDLTPATLIDSLIRRLDYIKFLNDGTPHGEARIENVRELLSVASEYQDLGLASFLEEVSLVSELEKTDSGSDAV